MADIHPRERLFDAGPSLTVHDPLAELLGAGDGTWTYTFDDAVRLAGHACPTVAGAYVTAVQAVRRLYGGETCIRGELRITLHGAEESGANGPFSQVLTLLTGAAGRNGFQGLGGHYRRAGLLGFGAAAEGPLRCTFERMDTGAEVTLAYDPASITADPILAPAMQAVLKGAADAVTRARFRWAWRDRVERIVADGGESTVREVPAP